MHYFGQSHPGGPAMSAEISMLCENIFPSLIRSDQRRWAEIYVRGLLGTSGKKSVKRISDALTAGNAEQCLQQFVNQSPWRSDAVRRDLALTVTATLTPDYWVLEDVVIPKNGQQSVGVEKQFAYPEGRTLNCQLGISHFLSGRDWSCPVNWRLALPPSWDRDHTRRAKTHVPSAERHRPRWQHMLAMIDEAAAQWRMPPRPVVGDLTPEPSADEFLRGLEERGLPYIMKVAAGRPMPTSPGTQGRLTAGQFITRAMRMDTTAVNKWQISPRRPGLSRILMVPVAPARGTSRRRYMAAEWSAARKAPHSVWITSFAPADTQRLCEGIEQLLHTREAMSTIYEDLGLRHFEGRSFTGWHHYATLVSAAAACRLLTTPRSDSSLEGVLLGSLLDARSRRTANTVPGGRLVAS